MGVLHKKQFAAMGIHYMYFSLEYMLAHQREAGYESMELWGASPHVDISPKGVGNRKELKAAIRASGMTLRCITPENCTYPWQFAARGRSPVEDSFQYFLRGIELCHELESPLMAVNSGWGLMDEPREEAWKRSIEMIGRLSKEAEKYGVTLVMESLRAEESNLVNSLSGMQAFLSELACTNVQPMIDTCAMAVAGETLEDWFSAFDGKIAHMHFVDGTPYGHLAWGDGDRDLDAYMNTLCMHNYQGSLTQEITDGRYFCDPYAADRKSMEVLKKGIETYESISGKHTAAE